MSLYIIKSLATKSGKSESEVEELWDKASDIAQKDGFEGEYDYTVGILKKMLNLNESTSAFDIGIYSSDVDTSTKVIRFHGHPYFTGPTTRKVFEVEEDDFYSIHKKIKNNETNTIKNLDVLDYIKINPDKEFYLKHSSTGLERKIKR